MQNSHLVSISDAANSLKVSEALVDKFINMGLVSTIQDGRLPKLTPYGIRRLIRIVDLYEQSFSPERIEMVLNH
jgi:Mn-dependent DtxR family transcriptional regulator